MRVIISALAEDDLARIYTDIATRQDIETAERFRARAEAALAQLGKHPLVGPYPGWVTCHQRLRFWVISRSRYVGYYEFRPSEISIERVLDGRRDVRRIVERGIEDPPSSED
ncbi:MAG: type II toxin-antitoxin system RelE/ParE family toxin [Limisphaerales bacterium]